MVNTLLQLTTCPLFTGLAPGEIREMLDQTHICIQNFNAGQPIALEGEECTKVGIVSSGGVDIQRIFPSGRVVTMDTLKPGDVFGEVILFSGIRVYPASITVNSDTQIIFITREDNLKLCSINPRFLDNLMGLLSNKILMLNRKIKNLSYQTVRQKVADMILEEYKKQKGTSVHLPFSRKEMADLLGIPRPSLSREMALMKEEGAIDFYMNSIKILKPDLLEEYLFT